MNFSIFLQETFVLRDVSFYDKAISTDYNNTWENYNNRLNVVRDAQGTLLTNTNNASGYWTAINNPPSQFAVEFDVISINGNVYIAYDNENKIRLDSRVTNGDKVKLEYNNGSTDIYVNGSLVSTLSTTGLRYIAFLIYPNNTVKYKEFMIYPIE